jgi:hypothetical protein
MVLEVRRSFRQTFARRAAEARTLSATTISTISIAGVINRNNRLRTCSTQDADCH